MTMGRFYFPLFLVATIAGAAEPHVRIKTAQEIVDDEELEMAGTFMVSKGFKCRGEFAHGKGMSRKCQGNITSAYDVGVSAEDIAKELSKEIFDQTNSFVPDYHEFQPDEDIMKELAAFDDVESFENLEEGFSKTVEFGGSMKAEWGCKVTFGWKGGKFTKKAECSFKGEGSKGPKSDEADFGDEF